MNPVVVIATHNRVSVTSRNIDTLLQQSVIPKIVLVATKENEIEHFRKYYPDVTIVGFENNPLGAKWQEGVRRAKELHADPLIITGSDDFLGNGFIEQACKKVEEGNHFVGLQRYYVHNKGRAYLIDYLAQIPLGGGRIYSLKMLQAIKWNVFDTTKSRHLDDLGFAMVKRSNLKVNWIREVEKEGLLLHAIKGDWEMMNPFNPNHKNMKIISAQPSYKVLPEIFIDPSKSPNDDMA